MKVLLAAAAFTVAACAVFVAFLWRSQERIVFQPPRPPYPDVGGATRVELRAADGQPLHAYVVGDAAGARGAVIVFHGNADLAGWQVPWGREVARQTGQVVVLAEYRGYGGLPGTPTYQGTKLDAAAVYAYVRGALRVDPGRISLFGHSLGTAVAAELAASVRPRALVLQSPFTSARDMARIIVARPVVLLWNAIARVHYDTEARVASLDCPVWVVHGGRDFVIPAPMGQRVFAAARMKGELLELAAAGHNDVPEVGDARYWAWLVRAVGGTAGEE